MTIMDGSDRRRVAIWTAASTTTVAALLVLQLLLVSVSIGTVEHLLTAQATSIHDYARRSLPLLSWIELAILVGVGVPYATRTLNEPRRATFVTFGGLIALTSFAVSALTASPNGDLLIDLNNYHLLRTNYAIALVIAFVTTSNAWFSMPRQIAADASVG